MASLMAMAVGAASAQQATISTPFNSVSDSFFERVGTSWGFNAGGVRARFGGGNPGVPPFGRFDPNAGLRTGVGFVGPGGNGFLNLAMGQGSRQSLVSQTPSVTMMNGGRGFVSDSSQSPFVIGYMPVVGGFPVLGSLVPVMPPVPYGPADSAGGETPTHYSDRVQAMRRLMAERNRTAAQQLDENGVVEGAAQRQVRAMAQPPAPVLRPPEPVEPRVGKGDRSNLCEAPGGPFRQIGPVPFSDADRASSATRAVPSVAEARRLHEIEQQSQEPRGARADREGSGGRGRRQAERGQNLLPNGRQAMHRRVARASPCARASRVRPEHAVTGRFTHL